MKTRLLSFLFALFSSLLLVACGGGGGGGDSSSSNNNQPQPTAVATAEVFVGDSLVAKLENGTQKTVSLANGSDSTKYGQGHSKKGDVLLIPTTSGLAVYNMATSSVVREIPLTGQIVNARHLDDNTALVLRRRERYSFTDNGRPITDANNLLTVSLTTGEVIRTQQLGSESTHLANGLSVNTATNSAWIVMTPPWNVSQGKVLKVSLSTSTATEVSGITGNPLACGENSTTLFLCYQRGGGVALNKTDDTLRTLVTESETQGYAEDATYSYYSLFNSAQLVRVNKATGGKETVSTGANPTAVFLGKNGEVLVIDSDPATTPSKSRLMKHTFGGVPTEVYSSGSLYQYNFR